MEKQENLYKIIVVLLTFIYPYYVFGNTDFDKLKISASINGVLIDGDLTLRDKDLCEFFLADENGERITMPEDWSDKVQWGIVFKENDSENTSSDILDTGLSNHIEFNVTPPFMGREFVNQNVEHYRAYLQRGKIYCNVKGHNYEREFNLDVICIPELEIIDQKVISDPEYPEVKYPLVTFRITTNRKFDNACLFFYDTENPSLPPYGWYLPDGSYDTSFIYEEDKGFFLCGFKLDTYNDYGIGASQMIFTDILPTSVDEIEKEKIGITCKNGVLEIKGQNTFRNIRITSITGKLCFNDNEQRNHINVKLEKGFYILSFDADDNKKTTRKILIQ